jgi:hypothetical protein
MVNDLPFIENGRTRIFSALVDPSELQWHWDEEHRVVTAQHETDWFLQLDNQLPQPFVPDVSVFIPAGTWHRVIKGTGDLSLTVIKHAVGSS